MVVFGMAIPSQGSVIDIKSISQDYSDVVFFQSILQIDNFQSMKGACKMERDCLSQSVLQSMIHFWVQRKGQSTQYDFRVSIKRVVGVDALLKEKSLQYLMLRKFAWMVRDLQEETMLSLNLQLKQQYQKLALGSFLKDGNAFEVLMIYLVRLTAHFLTDSFTNVQSDLALEAELFVILYYTFLGLEISAKTYEIMSRKYTTLRPLHPTASTPAQSIPPDEKPFRDSKKSEMDSISKVSKEAKLFRFSRSTDPLRYSRQSFCKWGETARREPLAEFTALLKENLHVPPLPPLKRKKVKAQELERINSEPTETIEHSSSPNKSGEGTVGFSLKKRQIFSNQLSNSIKTLHPNSLLFELSSKGTKLHQSFYQPHQQIPKQDCSPQSHSKMVQVDSLAKASSPKGKCDDWRAIVQELKRKVVQLKDKDHEVQDRRRQERDPSLNAISEESSVNTTQYHINAPNTIKEDVPHQQHRIEKQIDSACTSSLLKFHNSRDFKENFSIHTYQEGSDVPPSPSLALLGKQKRVITKNSIRIDKNSFATTCCARKSELMDASHINLHAEWIINHYKE